MGDDVVLRMVERRRRMAGAIGGLGVVFDPSAYGLDALTDKYGVFSTARVLTSWTGNLVRLRRSSDNAESDFGYVASTGWLDTAAVLTWGGADTLAITTVYDQGGNARDMVQTTAAQQPLLDLSGTHPAMLWDGVDDIMTSATMVAFAKNQPSATLIGVGKLAVEALTRGMQGASNHFAAQARCGMGANATNFYTSFGRRLNADSTQTTLLTISVTDIWVVEQGIFDWSGAKMYVYADTATAIKDPFQTAGLSENLDSVAVTIGAQSTSNLMKGPTTLHVFTRDLLTDAQALAFASSLAPLKAG